MEVAPTYLAEHQEEYSAGHAGGGRLSVEPTHPRQLRQKSAPLILQPWRRAGSRDSRLVFQVVRFDFSVWYLAALLRLLPEFHRQVLTAFTFSPSALREPRRTPPLGASSSVLFACPPLLLLLLSSFFSRSSAWRG